MIKAKRVYKLVERLLDVNVIGSKWVYTLNFNRDKELSKKKAKIVVQEFI